MTSTLEKRRAARKSGSRKSGLPRPAPVAILKLCGLQKDKRNTWPSRLTAELLAHTGQRCVGYTRGRQRENTHRDDAVRNWSGGGAEGVRVALPSVTHKRGASNE